MGNVAKYLCYQAREHDQEPPLRGKLRDRTGNPKYLEEKKKLKALSCLSPSRGSFEKDQCNKKSVNSKPCIHDYILYTVA